MRVCSCATRSTNAKGGRVSRVAKQEGLSSAPTRWEGVVFPAAFLGTAAVSFVAATLLASALDHDSLWPLWGLAVLYWLTCASLSVPTGVVLGHVVGDGAWLGRLVRSGRIWVIALTSLTIVLSVLIPLRGPHVRPLGEPVVNEMFQVAVFLSGWGMGVPLGLLSGLWLAARRRAGVVEQAFRADSRELH